MEFFYRRAREERIAAESEADARKRAQHVTLAEQYEAAVNTYKQLEATRSAEVRSTSEPSSEKTAKQETFFRF